MKYDITINQGQTYELSLIYKKQTGELYDLTGCSVAMQARQSPEDEAVLDLAEIEDGVTIMPLEGHVLIQIPAEVTAGLPAKRFKYDLILVYLNGVKRRLLQGWLTVISGITHD